METLEIETPTTEAPQSDGLDMSSMMNDSPGSTPAGDTTIAITPAAAAPADTPAAAGIDAAFEAWFRQNYAEAPDGVKVDNWKAQRQWSEQTLKQFAATSLERDALKKEIDALRTKVVPGDGAPVLPEAEAVQRLAAELEAVKQEKATALKEWDERKLKDELEGNHAFLSEFDGRRAALLDEAIEAAQEAGLDAEKVEAIFAATSEYQLTKALADIDDDAAARLLKDKAGAFIKLSKEREAAVKAPADSLKKWRDYESTLKGNMALDFRQQAMGKYTSAIPEVEKDLAGDPFFNTDVGRAVLGNIQGTIASGQLPTPAGVLKAMAGAEAASFYQHAWVQGREEIAALKDQLSRFVRADPAQSGQRGVMSSAGGGIGAGWFND